MNKTIHQLQKTLKNDLGFRSVYLSFLVLIILGFSLGFRSTINLNNSCVQLEDTLTFYAKDFSSAEIVLIDSVSKTIISLSKYMVYSVLHKDERTYKGTELVYDKNQCLEYKANVFWTPDDVSPRWINEYYMGDFELLGAKVRDYRYDGDFYMYEEKNKPMIIKYYSGSIIR